MPAYGANVAQRLDALETGPFHWRLLGLIGGGMFFDAFDNFLAGSVLGALVQQGLSDMHMNALFISMSFAGLTLGAWGAGVIGDRFGRRFSYQFNLLIFGVTSIAAALAPSMTWLIVLRFIMGIGLGAEIVVGYSTLNEFTPAHARGRFSSLLNLITNSSVLVSSACAFLIIPHFGWRWMFAIPGIGALVIWYLRKSMPESPRWLAAWSSGSRRKACVAMRRFRMRRRRKNRDGCAICSRRDRCRARWSASRWSAFRSRRCTRSSRGCRPSSSSRASIFRTRC
jgi:putative MFS transporter